MIAWAPTSTPRVGCAATINFGSPLNSRPTINFCWFPPESALANTLTPGVLTSNSSTTRLESSAAAPLLTQIPFAIGDANW